MLSVAKALGFLAALCHQRAAALNISAHKIKAMMAAAYTPMKAGGMELDLDVIPKYAAHIARLNISNVMPCGTNGESLSLSVQERKQLAEAWGKAAPQYGLKVYVHIGSESVVETADLMRHASQTAGISGAVAMPPVYFKPTLETLHRFLAAVAKVAPEFPFWFYHFPDATGVLPGQAHALLKVVDDAGDIPNFMGIKYTDYNMMDFQLALGVGAGKYNMLYSRDEQALPALQLGADGVVSSTIQYAPSLRRVVTLYQRGKLEQAKAEQLKNAELCSHFGQFESQSKNVQKNIMGMVGMAVGSSRLPKIDLLPDEYSQLEMLLASKDFIDKLPAFVV